MRLMRNMQEKNMSQKNQYSPFCSNYNLFVLKNAWYLEKTIVFVFPFFISDV